MPGNVKKHPHLVILAGPNGAGKSTAAPLLLRGALGVDEFVNADVIARGLSAFQPELAAMSAGRIMLTRLHELASRKADFAFETTLASRSFAPRVRQLLANGYGFSLIFLWLQNPDIAIARVAERVRSGGHSVPNDTIRRRYEAGLRNFFRLYQPLAGKWYFYDNSIAVGPQLIAEGSRCKKVNVRNRLTWRRILRKYANE
jgi:predicted ABC-type ATPase